MPKIERRRTVVTLYQGNIKQELADKRAELEKALDADAAGPKRASTKSKAPIVAAEHDAMLAKAEEDAVKVALLELPQSEYQPIADDHPPRQGEPLDAQNGVNMKTFPGALLRACVADRELDIDALSPAHFTKLGTAAWNLHNEDGDFPKFSMLSLLKQARERDSEPQPDSE